MSSVPLVLLPHAGGTAQVFGTLVLALPTWVEPVPLELPGRGRRWREDPVHTASAAVDDLVEQLAESGVTGTFAMFGHSMGAYLGLALAARLEGVAGRLRCSTLFASANAGPLVARTLFPGDPLQVADEEVLRAAARFGGLAPEVLAHEQLRRRAVRVPRTDFAVCDSLVRGLRHTTIGSRLVVCCGTDDVFTDAQLDAWRSTARAETTFIRFPGDHFSLRGQGRAVAQLVASQLAVPVAPASDLASSEESGGTGGS